MERSDPARVYLVELGDLDADKGEILALWARNIPDLPYPVRRFAWEYQENPAGPARCWLLIASPGHRRVGACSLVFRRLRVGESTRLGGRVSLLAVDAGHRFLAPARTLIKAVLADAVRLGVDPVFTVSPPRAAGVAKRAGFRDVGPYVRHAKALDTTPHLQALLHSPTAGRVLAPIANLALRTISRDTWLSSQGLLLEELETFDHRFDDLWERARQHYPVTTDRTADFLRWRYTRCPYDTGFVTLGLFSAERTRLVGYGVFAIQKNRADIFDLVTEEPGRTLDVLVSGLIASARGRNAQTVSIMFHGPDWFHQTLMRFGFWLRHDEPEPPHLLVASAQASPIRRHPAGSSNWYVLPADNF